jgi:hypothetical protein
VKEIFNCFSSTNSLTSDLGKKKVKAKRIPQPQKTSSIYGLNFYSIFFYSTESVGKPGCCPRYKFGDSSWQEHRPRERQSPHWPDFFTMAGDYGFCPRFGLPGLPGKRPVVLNFALK